MYVCVRECFAYYSGEEAEHARDVAEHVVEQQHLQPAAFLLQQLLAMNYCR